MKEIEYIEINGLLYPKLTLPPQKEIHLTSYEELLGIEDNQENSVDKITEIPIDCLYGFKNHPFHVINDEKMQETVDSIKEYGGLNPCIVS